jgi:hypothetical protein
MRIREKKSPYAAKSKRPVAGPGSRMLKGGNAGYRYINLRTATASEKFEKWAKALIAKGYRHMAFDGTRFMFSAQPIPPGDRRGGPYSRMTPDTDPRIIRDVLLSRQQRQDKAGWNEGRFQRTERLIAEVLRA